MVFVGGITHRSNTDRLYSILDQFGKVNNIELVKTKEGELRGYCFVTFEYESSATKALNSQNIWLDDRLLSVRPMKQGRNLENTLTSTRGKRITIYGFRNWITQEDKDLTRNFFSNLGKLEIYYFVNMRCDKIINKDINDYIKVMGIRKNNKSKIYLLNLGYSDESITSKLRSQNLIQLGLQRLRTTKFTIYKEFNKKGVQKVTQPTPSLPRHPQIANSKLGSDERFYRRQLKAIRQFKYKIQLEKKDVHYRNNLEIEAELQSLQAQELAIKNKLESSIQPRMATENNTLLQSLCIQEGSQSKQNVKKFSTQTDIQNSSFLYTRQYEVAKNYSSIPYQRNQIRCSDHKILFTEIAQISRALEQASTAQQSGEMFKPIQDQNLRFNLGAFAKLKSISKSN